MIFLLNQNGTSSFNVAIIDQISAVAPRVDDTDKHPLVIALMGNREEILGRYETMDDCRIAIDFVSFLINKGTTKIAMPKYEQVKAMRSEAVKKIMSANDGTLDVGALADNILKSILSDKGIILNNRESGGPKK